MNAIIQTFRPNRKVKIRIIKDGFSSPVLGRPNYIGKICTLPASTAQRFVDEKIAEFVENDEVKAKEPDTDKTPDGGDVTDEPPLALEEAVKQLNPDEPTHWTKAGLPDLNTLKELTGRVITRKEFKTFAPGYTREDAAKKED